MKFEKIYKRLGPSTLLIEWPDTIKEEVVRDVIRHAKTIGNLKIPGVIEITGAYRSIAIHYHADEIRFENLVSILEKVKFKGFKKSKPQIWRLPVCYHSQFGPDLESLAKKLKLTPGELITLHTESTYMVSFIGFLPGFLYLSGLHQRLQTPRKETPARAVSKGSVAIGGFQTGIYPADSPGGWQVIGNCPVSLFDPNQTPPCFIQPGDSVRFEAIGYETYRKVLKEAESGNFDFKIFLTDGKS